MDVFSITFTVTQEEIHHSTQTEVILSRPESGAASRHAALTTACLLLLEIFALCLTFTVAMPHSMSFRYLGMGGEGLGNAGSSDTSCIRHHRFLYVF